MFKKILYTVVLTIATLSMSHCSGSDSSDDGGGDILPPKATNLIAPTKDEACNQGNAVSDTESNVRFEWSKADHATNYTLVVKNLNTNTVQESPANDVFATVKLLKGMPYSWYVISKSNKTTTTATSETWKFYNAGEGIANYAPFPAELISPKMGATTSATTTLEWLGSDIDNDISAYNVYLGTTSPPTNLQTTTTGTTVANMALTSNTVYYWKVVTTDSQGNNSTSQIFEFRTE